MEEPLRLTPPYTPELLPAVQDFVAKLLPCSVLELGSGYSSIWFAKHGCRVTTYEHDQAWAEAVLNVGAQLDMVFAPDFVVALKDERPHDLVYLDCREDMRLACLPHAMRLTEPGGWLIVDDTHWAMFRQWVYHWPAVIFDGDHRRHDGSVHYHHTTVLRRCAS
jgi:predicted O-methyltransferase YrrM